MSTSAEAPAGAPAMIRDILSRAKAPISFKALGKQGRWSGEALQAILATEEGKPGIFRWPDARGQQRFWSFAAEEFVRQRILDAASECAMPAGLLIKHTRKRAYGYPEKLMRSLLQQLIKDKELRKYSAFGRESSLVGRTGFPAAYAEAAQRFIEDKIVAKVRAEGGSMGYATHESQAATGGNAADAILATMRRLESSDSAPVSVRELRIALPSIDKLGFDAAALALRSEQKAFLSRHDYPQSLSVEERNLLIDGQDGNYYVAITARRE